MYLENMVSWIRQLYQNELKVYKGNHLDLFVSFHPFKVLSKMSLLHLSCHSELLSGVYGELDALCQGINKKRLQIVMISGLCLL